MDTVEQISSLLQSGESQTLEFKSSFDRETIETLVAFANTNGGKVLIGIADDPSVRGVTLGKETLNEWLGQIKSSTSPSIIPDLEAAEFENRTIIAIQINEYPVKPVNTKGRYFKRIATSRRVYRPIGSWTNHQLSLSEITDLCLQTLQLSWDS
jgi:ATP-dependent DNA helicase RecG